MGGRSHRLTVRHGPIPFKGNQTLQAHEIKQLYCQGHGRTNVGNHKLVAVLNNNRKVTLLSKHANRDMILYLEQQIERRLGIQDKAMPGEVPR